MSVWLEKEDDSNKSQRASMTDVIFKIDCHSLPVDHAAALSEALCSNQPWLKQVANTGIHSIHVAGSQNGWQRPESDDQPLLLSKRTRLKVRIESGYSEQLIESLTNTTHVIDQHPLKILQGRIAPLHNVSTLFSRYTVYMQNQVAAEDENLFVQHVISDCERIGYAPTKVLCGRSNTMMVNGEKIPVRSVMLADIPPEHSFALQEQGLGDMRLIGCGLMIPHKDTVAVG